MVKGEVFACGQNDFGQSGLGDTRDRNSFTQVINFYPKKNLSEKVLNVLRISKSEPITCSIKKVRAGLEHTIFLPNDNRVFGCERNALGELGLGNVRCHINASQVNLPKKIVVKDISTGNYTSYLLSEDGDIFSCGSNWFGELRFGPLHYNKTTFTIVKGLPRVKEIKGNGVSTILLTIDNRIFSCSNNQYRQLGLGSHFEPSFPLSIFPELAFLEITVRLKKITSLMDGVNSRSIMFFGH